MKKALLIGVGAVVGVAVTVKTIASYIKTKNCPRCGGMGECHTEYFPTETTIDTVSYPCPSCK